MTADGERPPIDDYEQNQHGAQPTPVQDEPDPQAADLFGGPYTGRQP